MSCRNIHYKKLLPLYEAGRLDGETRREMEAHLLECPHCASEYYEMIPVMETIRDMESPFPEAIPLPRRWTLFTFRWKAMAALFLLVTMVSLLSLVVIPNLSYLPRTLPTADLNRILKQMEEQQWSTVPEPVENGRLISRAWQLYRAERYEECLRLVAQQADDSANHAESRVLAARCHLALNQPDQAREVLLAYDAGPKDPYFTEILFLKAQAYLETGQVEAAVQCLTLLVDRGGEYSDESRQILEMIQRVNK
jgi:hypothetical protein